MFKRSKRAIAADGLVVTLQAGPTPTSVLMQVANPTSTTKTFCTYHTPFEGLRNDLFTITGPGAALLDYRGMMAKRAPPDDDDFRDVAPGAVLVSGPLDLVEGYAVTAGTWSVVFAGNGISGLPASAPVSITVP